MVDYLEAAGEVETRYAVIVPDQKQILSKYLHLVLEEAMPEFLHKHRTGINLQFAELDFLQIPICDIGQQKEIVKSISELEKEIRYEEQEIMQWKSFKKYMLEKMFI